MVKPRFSGVFRLVSLAILVMAGVVAAADVPATVDSVAGWLLGSQVKNGAQAGSWETSFNGPIVSGMVSAYQYRNNTAYRDAALLGGQYILIPSSTGELNLLGDEAYALTRLSEISTTPLSNQWRSAVSNFYSIVNGLPKGANTYISQYDLSDSSYGVFYLAHHVVAVYYVNGAAKEFWLTGLVNRIAAMRGGADPQYPVMALGTAVWALAQVGALTSVPVPGGWNCNRSDLPTILLSHQVPQGQPNAGSFYWRFDHGNGGTGLPVSGYTEDTTWAILGLVAAAKADSTLKAKVDAAVAAAQGGLIAAAGADGKVYESLTAGTYTDPVFGGELLQLLPNLPAQAPAATPK